MYKITCDSLPILDIRHEDFMVIDPMVNVETNTVGECTFKIHSNHPHYNDLHSLKSVFEVTDENGVIFRGRMTNNTRDFYNGKVVDLEGAMAFFNDSMVKPFVFPDDFSDVTSSDNVVEYFLNWLIENHNSQVQDFQQFKLGNVSVTDPNNYIIRSNDSIASTWQTLKEKLFESSLGGDLCIRYEADGNYIDYLADFEEINEQAIIFGENLLDMRYETDASTTYSAIIPLGADIEIEPETEDGETTTVKLTLESVPNGAITDDIYKVTLSNGLHALYSKTAVENYGWICCPIEDSTWDDVTDAENLLQKASSFLSGTAMFLADHIEVTAADLHFTDAQIRSFRIYKKVRVVTKPHGIATYYKLNKLGLDLLNPQNTKIVVGQTKKTLTDSVIKNFEVKDGKDGTNGTNGKTTYLHIAYGTDINGSNFSTTYFDGATHIGTCTNFTEADPTTASSYTWALIKGKDGTDGTNGVSVTSVDVMYYRSTSNTSLTGGSWVSDAPAWVNGTYIWSKTVVTYSSGDPTESDPVCITGAKGSDGSDGSNGSDGSDGSDGKDGVGVVSIIEQYYQSTSATALSGGSWSTTVPTWADGTYIWTRSVITYTEGDPATTDPICVTGSKGDTGDTGATGTGIESITTQFYLSTSKTTQTGGSWVTTMPSWTRGKYLWTRSKIVYKNPASTVYTTPICDSSWEAANDAEKVATNFLDFGGDYGDGLVIGDLTASVLGRNAYIDSEGFYIRDGTDTVLASFGETVTIGETNSNNVYIDDEGMYIRKNGTVLAHFTDDLVELGKKSTSAKISMCGGKAQFAGCTIEDGTGIALKANLIRMSSKFPAESGSSSVPYIQFDSKGFNVNGIPTKGNKIYHSNGTSICTAWLSSGTYILRPDEDNAMSLGTTDSRWKNVHAYILRTYDNSTTSSGVAARIYSNRIYRYSSSSRRYKKDIAPVTDPDIAPEKLYEAEVVQFKYNDGYLIDEDPRNDKLMTGFIVEDLEKIYPIAIDYNDDGTPEMWNANIIIPSMLKLIQDQHKEIELLKTEVQKLKEKAAE